MQESIQAALTVSKLYAKSFQVSDDFFEQHDIHIHLPEGATPKDGPSAGIGMCTAILSALSQQPINAKIAMTGEITLRGKVLAIGGLKEKLLAAVRAQVQKVLIPKDNQKDLQDIPQEVKQALNIVIVETIEEVLFHCFEQFPMHIHSDATKANTRTQSVTRPTSEEVVCV